MAQQDTVRITPEDIVNFILEEMVAGTCPTYYSNLVPSTFDVYLYGEDLQRLRSLEQRMREEACSALAEKLVAINKTAQKKSLLTLGAATKKGKPYERLGDWSVTFHENTDDDAQANPLVIHSTFPATPEVEDRVGTMTERVTKRGSDGQTTTSSTQRTGNLETRRVTGVVFANLSYEDESGAHTFQMTKDLIKIGRGSVDHWVDLKLNSKKDVSREHLQIRRDPSSGKFFIKDLSSLGTTVDGKRVPPSIEHRGEQELDANIEIPLPSKAHIGLADVVSINFKTAK